MPKYQATSYIRLSYTDDRSSESDSVTNQRKLIENFIERNPDIEIISEKIDDGYSGIIFDRPAFKEMMQDITDGKINCVIVKDLSRLGREYIETGRYLRRVFPAYGVRFIAITDNIDTAHENSGDDLTVSVKNIMNEAYCRDISIKTRTSLDIKRRNGDFVGAFPVYGYMKSEENKNLLVPDPYAARVVQDIFRMRLDGTSALRIATVLNDMGILSPLAYKKNNGFPYAKHGYTDKEDCKWSATTVIRILQDETYTGALVQGKQGTPHYTGTAQKTVGLATLRELLIPVAPYKEQMQIYAQTQDALSIVDSLSSDKEDLLNIIENARAKILDLAIRGQLVPQDPDDEPASALLERIRAEKEELIRQGKIKRNKKEPVIFRGEDNSYYVRQGTHTESIDDQFIFDLPDNWKWCSLLNVAKIELGKTLDSVKNTGTNHPYLRSVNVRWNEVDLADLKEMRFEPEEVDRYTVRRNDLLICEGGDVGRSCVWTNEKEILYQNALHRVRFYGECNPFYFMYYMMYYESRGIIKALCKGVTIKHLTGNVLSLIPFALPPLEEQGRIVERLNQMFALLDTILCD